MSREEAQRLAFARGDAWAKQYAPKSAVPVPRPSSRNSHGVVTLRTPKAKDSRMAKDEFDSAGSYVAIKDLLGELVLFTPTEYIEEVKTDFGDKDAVMTDIVVLSQGGVEYEDAMIFQGSLIGALKRKIPTGRKLLGVVAKGEAKKGQNAPYILEAPTDEQKQIARNYLAGLTIEAATSAEPEDPFAVKSL